MVVEAGREAEELGEKGRRRGRFDLKVSKTADALA